MKIRLHLLFLPVVRLFCSMWAHTKHYKIIIFIVVVVIVVIAKDFPSLIIDGNANERYQSPKRRLLEKERWSKRKRVAWDFIRSRVRICWMHLICHLAFCSFVVPLARAPCRWFFQCNHLYATWIWNAYRQCIYISRAMSMPFIATVPASTTTTKYKNPTPKASWVDIHIPLGNWGTTNEWRRSRMKINASKKDEN